MANPFDQFVTPDAPTAAPADAPPAPYAEAAPPDTGVNPFDKFVTAPTKKPFNPMVRVPPKKTEPLTWSGAGKAVGSGLVEGGLGIAALPGNLNSVAENAGHWLAQRYENNFGSGRKLPMPSETEGLAGDAARLTHKVLPTTRDLEDTNFLGLGAASKYEPKNAAERGLKYVSSFAPAALTGPFGVAGNLTKLGALPAAATAIPHFLMSDQNPYKQAAELAAGVLTGGAASVLTRPGASEVLGRYLKRVTPAGFDKAADLQAAGRDIGVPLSVGEVLPGTGLNKLQRHLEGTPKVGSKFAQFYEGRPAQVEAAGNTSVDRIGPAPTDPSQIGPAVQRAADLQIENTRRDINTAADPFYAAAAHDYVDPAAFASLTQRRGFRAIVKRLRKTPEFRDEYGHLPLNSVPVFDVIKKVLDKSDVPRVGEDAIENWARGVRGRLKADVRTAATDASDPYATALKIGEFGRERVLDPMRNEPIGKLAETPNVKAQGSIILPTNPEPNSSFEIGKAIREIQKTDPESARDLASNHIRKVLNEATQDNMGGPNQWGGAKFNAILRGNTEQGKVLATVVRAVGGNAAWDGLQKVLDVFQATGRRLAEGSPTEPNRLFSEAMKAGSPLPEFVATAASPTKWFSFAKNFYDSRRYGKNLNQIADIFLAPDGVRQLQKIAGMAKGGPRILQSIMTMFEQAQLNGQPDSPKGPPLADSKRSAQPGGWYFDENGKLQRAPASPGQ